MREWIRRSFQNRIFASVLLITLVPLLLCNLLMIRLQVDNSRQGQRQSALNQLKDLDGEFTRLRQEFSRVSGELTGYTPLRSALRKGSADSRVVYQVLFRDTRQLRDLADFSLYDAQGRCCYTTAELFPQRDTGWGILRAAGNSRELEYRSGEEDYLLEASRAIRGYGDQILGYLVISMNQEHFEALFEGCYHLTGDVLLLDRFFGPVYCSRSSGDQAAAEQLRRQLLKGEPLTDPQGSVGYYAVATGAFFLVLQQPLTFTDRALSSFYTISGLLGLVCLGLCLVYALVLSRHLARPVHRLDRAMAAVRKGDYSVRLEVDRQDELGRLAESFNRMSREYSRNLDRSVRHQQELNQVQLRMMQAQLNPHFLYNTLDSIKWLGVTHRVPQVAEMATDLAAVLRASISRDAFVTLEQELELIERYLQIQYLRFEDRFACEIDVAEQFQHCRIPKLTLLPLVENAIIHAVAEQEDGYIKITAHQEGEDLLLMVTDNGCGIPREMLEQLNGPEKQLPGNHLGLYNVDRIARLHFGESYGVTLRSQLGRGTQAQFRIPLVRQDPEIAKEGEGEC